MEFKFRYFLVFLFFVLSFFATNLACSRPRIQQKQILERKQITQEQIENLYKGISGFGISTDDRNTIESCGGDATYGEIKFESAEHLLNDLDLTRKDVFYDLGSGVGKFVVQAYLNSPIKKSCGIELSQDRHNKAQSILEKLKKEKKLQKIDKFEFRCEDIKKTNLNDATVIFMCSSCFSKKLMQDLVTNFSRLKKGLKVLTLQDLPKNKSFKFIKKYTLPMTWSSNSTVYLYELV